MKKFLSTKRKLILLFVLSLFVVIATSIIALPTVSATKESIAQKLILRNKVTESQLPVLYKVSNFPVLSAQGVIAIDMDSAVVLYEKNADARVLPASTTKILTALVSLNSYNLEDVVTIGPISVIGQKMHLVHGEKITVGDLLKGLLIYSANDAAEALASNYPGGRDAFIAKMNEEAVALSLTNSHFVNPSGLDAIDHYSSARDLVRLSEVAMRNPIFAEIVKTKNATVTSTNGKIVHKLKNINELLGKVEGVEGVKTGWTEEARENLVSFVVRDNRRIMIALLGSQDRFGESEELINWLYKNVNWQDVTYSK